jgi:hypothetical protein
MAFSSEKIYEKTFSSFLFIFFRSENSLHQCKEYSLSSSIDDLKSKNKILIESSEQTGTDTETGTGTETETEIYSAEKNRLFMEEILREFDKSNIGGKNEKDENEEDSNGKSNRLMF